jgi:hypothetical protein
MSPPEYIAGFFLIIIGFAVAELLKGSARLIRERKQIKFYWPFFIIIPFLFEILIFWFIWIFSMIKSDTDQVWTVFEIIDISIQVIPWAFVSYLIFPSRIKEGFDMKDFYFEHGKIIILITIALATYVIIRMLASGNTQGIVTVIISLVTSVIVLVGFKRIHLAWLITTVLLINYFIFFAKPLTIG